MTQTPKGKPLPQITDQTRPFWSGAKQGKLMMQNAAAAGLSISYQSPGASSAGTAS